MSGCQEKGHEQRHHQENDRQEEDKEECAWCRWMKGGGCKSQFEVWQQCVDGVRDAGRDDVESCASVMGPLWDCMAKNSDYYAVQLDAVKQKSPGDEEQQSQEQEMKDKETS